MQLRQEDTSTKRGFGRESPRWAWSPEARAMFHADLLYSGLTRSAGGRWLLLKRPLLLTLILGCTISLITSGRLTLRLVTSGAVTWSFVPLLQITSLAVVSGMRRVRPLRESVDLFFMGQGPWLCWLVAFGAFWSSASPVSESIIRTPFWFGSAAAAGIWSAHIDYWFFRRILERTRYAAARDLVMQRAIAWGLGIIYFGWGSLWPDIVGRLGR